MSKAFTSEETPEPVSAVRAPPSLRPGEIRYVTPEGQAALRAELQRLQAPGAVSGLASEERARRALLVERTLAALTVLGPERVPDGEVGFGTWVELEDEDGARSTWRIVGPDEADGRRGQVSAHAPLGQALMGRTVGEAVEVQRPGGAREYTVLAVHKTPPG